MGEVEVASLDGEIDSLFVERVRSSPEHKLGDEVTAVESSEAPGSFLMTTELRGGGFESIISSGEHALPERNGGGFKFFFASGECASSSRRGRTVLLALHGMSAAGVTSLPS